MGLKISTLALAVAAGAIGFASQAVFANGPIPVPNGSFEGPVVPPVDPYASPNVDSWTKTGLFQDTGVFFGYGSVDNIDGTQGAFLFGNTGTKLSQAIGANFELGTYYHASFDVQGGGYGMPLGAQIKLALFYLDDSSTRIEVGSVTATNDYQNVPDYPYYQYNPETDQYEFIGLSWRPLTHLTRWSFDTPVVDASFAGKPIEMDISVLGTNAGYWDIDNVQLVQLPEPASLSILAMAGAGLLMRRRRA